MLTVDSFVLVLGTGAAAVGLWVAVRLQRFTPKSVLGVIIDLMLAWGALQMTSPLLSWALRVLDPGTAVMLTAFPALVVAFAAAAWVIMFFQALLRPYR